MKKILIILVLIALIVVLLHAALFIFINLKGRDIIVAKLKKDFGGEVKLDSLSLSFPFAIEIKNFQCADLSFRRAKASIGLCNPFRRCLISNLYLEDPVINITLDRKGLRAEPLFSKQWSRRSKEPSEPVKEKFTLPSQGSTPQLQDAEPLEAKPKAGRQFLVTIKNLYIKEGRIELSDELRRQPIVTTINAIDAYLKNISYPKPVKFSLDASGCLKTREGVSRKNLNLKGWVDYLNKTMELDLALDEIDYTAFEAYFPPSWQSESLGVKTALFSLNSNFTSKSNDLAIKNSLLLDSIEYLEPAEGEEENLRAKNLKTILAFFADDLGKYSFNFVIKTKMDSPRIDFGSIKESFKATFPISPAMILQGVVNNVKESVAEKAGNTKELTVDEAIDIFKQTGEGIVDTLKNILIPKKEVESE